MTLTMLALVSVVFLQAAGDKLFEAASAGDVAATKNLLAGGADVNAKGLYDQTPIFFAADRGHLEVVRVLIDAGAKLDVKDSFYSMTPISRAAMKKRYDVIKLMLEKGSDGASQLLMQAANGDDTELAKAVIASGKAAPTDMSAALAMAERGKKAGVVEALKAAGAKPQAPANFAVETGILNSYAGKYVGGRGGNEFEVEVSVESGRLKAMFGTSPMIFGAMSNTEFRNDERQLILMFHAKEGAVTGFSLQPWGQEFKRKQ